jgi:tetratricopeptide (TPR) repeat protein
MKMKLGTFFTGGNSMIAIALIFIYLGGSSCSVSPYRRAELHLDHQEDEAALKQYLALIEVSKPKPDLRAMVGAAIAYRNLKNYRACMKMCQLVLKYQPNNAAALYYMGSALEELGMERLALSFYQRHQFVSRSDPYYTFLKARLNIIKLRHRNL